MSLLARGGSQLAQPMGPVPKRRLRRGGERQQLLTILPQPSAAKESEAKSLSPEGSDQGETLEGTKDTKEGSRGKNQKLEVAQVSEVKEKKQEQPSGRTVRVVTRYVKERPSGGRDQSQPVDSASSGTSSPGGSKRKRKRRRQASNSN